MAWLETADAAGMDGMGISDMGVTDDIHPLDSGRARTPEEIRNREKERHSVKNMEEMQVISDIVAAFQVKMCF